MSLCRRDLKLLTLKLELNALIQTCSITQVVLIMFLQPSLASSRSSRCDRITKSKYKSPTT